MLLLVGVTLAPSAVPVASACQGDTHTVQTACLHETPRDYIDCYVFHKGPGRWLECV
jgi:hypothetical protein